MNREEFLRQLERLLAGIPEEERQEALEYYAGYFDDAGPGKESRVIEELGSPAKVAAMIKADLREGGADYGEFTERGYEDPRMRRASQVPGQYVEGSVRRHRQSRNTGRLLLLILVAIFAAPVIFGVGGTAIGLVTGIFGILVGLFVGLPCAAIGLAGAGVGLVVAGIHYCFSTPAVGMAVMGVGFFLVALGILFLLALVVLACKTLPWLFGKIKEFWRHLSGKRAAGGGAPGEKQGGV